MKNIELLDICYKFFNRYITIDKLIEILNELNKTNLSKKELEKINELINDIQNISNNIPNKEDEYIKDKKSNIKQVIEKLENVQKNEQLEKYISKLKEEYYDDFDSKERWSEVTKYINNNDYFNECFNNLTNYELLEFIAKDICASFPPPIKEEKFQELVKVGIEKDKREWLWRLAFNYEDSNFNFDSIIDYFIQKKDGYYMVELISAIGEYLDIDSILNKINDKEIIEYFIENKILIDIFVSDEQLEKLKSKI